MRKKVESFCQVGKREVEIYIDACAKVILAVCRQFIIPGQVFCLHFVECLYVAGFVHKVYTVYTLACGNYISTELLL